MLKLLRDLLKRKPDSNAPKQRVGDWHSAYGCHKCPAIRDEYNSGICPTCGEQKVRKVVARYTYEWYSDGSKEYIVNVEEKK